jgi:hypothetical protein
MELSSVQGQKFKADVPAGPSKLAAYFLGSLD